MRATSAAPVAIVFASNATATFPPANRSPMMPDPTTAARSSAVPTASAVARRAMVNCCVSVAATFKPSPRFTLQSRFADRAYPEGLA